MFYKTCKNILFLAKYVFLSKCVLFKKIYKYMTKIVYFILFLKTKKYLFYSFFFVFVVLFINKQMKHQLYHFSDKKNKSY